MGDHIGHCLRPVPRCPAWTHGGDKYVQLELVRHVDWVLRGLVVVARLVVGGGFSSDHWEVLRASATISSFVFAWPAMPQPPS